MRVSDDSDPVGQPLSADDQISAPSLPGKVDDLPEATVDIAAMSLNKKTQID